VKYLKKFTITRLRGGKLRISVYSMNNEK